MKDIYPEEIKSQYKMQKIQEKLQIIFPCIIVVAAALWRSMSKKQPQPVIAAPAKTVHLRGISPRTWADLLKDSAAPDVNKAIEWVFIHLGAPKVGHGLQMKDAPPGAWEMWRLARASDELRVKFLKDFVPKMMLSKKDMERSAHTGQDDGHSQQELIQRLLKTVEKAKA